MTEDFVVQGRVRDVFLSPSPDLRSFPYLNDLRYRDSGYLPNMTVPLGVSWGRPRRGSVVRLKGTRMETPGL